MEKITDHSKLTVGQLRDALLGVPDDLPVRLNLYTNKVYGEQVKLVPNLWDYAGTDRKTEFMLQGAFMNDRVYVGERKKK